VCNRALQFLALGQIKKGAPTLVHLKRASGPDWTHYCSCCTLFGSEQEWGDRNVDWHCAGLQTTLHQRFTCLWMVWSYSKTELGQKLSWPWCLTVLPDPSSIRVKNIKIILEGKLISPSHRMTPKKFGTGERWTTVLYWINTRTLSSNTSLYNAHLVTFSGEREVAFRSKISDCSLPELNIKLYKWRLLIC
jgi:hypothetical protein